MESSNRLPSKLAHSFPINTGIHALHLPRCRNQYSHHLSFQLVRNLLLVYSLQILTNVQQHESSFTKLLHVSISPTHSQSFSNIQFAPVDQPYCLTDSIISVLIFCLIDLLFPYRSTESLTLFIYESHFSGSILLLCLQAHTCEELLHFSERTDPIYHRWHREQTREDHADSLESTES